MKFLKSMAISAVMLGAFAAPALATDCPVDSTIRFGVSNWKSIDFHTEVARKILEAGYGCKTESISADTLPALNALSRGDIDVYMESWVANAEKPWTDGLSSGKVIDLGINFPDAPQGWFVPKYLVEGEGAPAPDLRTVGDLAKYKDLFSDPEEPTKGRFYNCVLGWGCEGTNTKKLAVYGLDDDFTNFRPGSGGAFAAEIASAITRKQPIVFYYWGPSGLYGKIAQDVIMLEEAPYDEAKWSELQNSDAPTVATAYPNAPVHKGANAAFAEKAPKLIEMLKAYSLSTAATSKAISYMDEENADADEAAAWWLANNDAWKSWVSEDVAKKVEAAL